MKLSAIADNGSRFKDFIDIAYLSTHLSLKEMLTAFETKYPQTNPYRAVKGLTYYNDIRFSEKINLLGNNFKWEEITKRLLDMTKDETKRFSSLSKKNEVQESHQVSAKRGRRM